MISERYKGESLPELVGVSGHTGSHLHAFFYYYSDDTRRHRLCIGAADILDKISGGIIDIRWWMALIFIYFIVSTIFPIDKIIGRIYPVFGLALLFMAVGILVTLIPNMDNLPELNRAGLRNLHPGADHLPIFPMMFITVACGAISGFHATQSPLMARCIKTECDGRKVFYGAWWPKVAWP
jgi:carbon starvation protein CstA